MNYLNIENNKIEPVVNELNILLADYHIYYQNLRTFHWNILGENFFDLHAKFESLYNNARLKIDEIAERILTLQYHPISKTSHYLSITSIKESESNLSDKKMVASIIKNHKLILQQMSKVIQIAQDNEDEGTLDLLGSYIAELEKESWMLNAWTKNNNEELSTSKILAKT